MPVETLISQTSSQALEPFYYQQSIQSKQAQPLKIEREVQPVIAPSLETLRSPSTLKGLNITPRVLQNRPGGHAFDILFPEEVSSRKSIDINSDTERTQTRNAHLNIRSVIPVDLDLASTQETHFKAEVKAVDFALKNIQKPLDNRDFIPDIVPRLDLQNVSQESAQKFRDISREEENFDDTVIEKRLIGFRAQFNEEKLPDNDNIKIEPIITSASPEPPPILPPEPPPNSKPPDPPPKEVKKSQETISTPVVRERPSQDIQEVEVEQKIVPKPQLIDYSDNKYKLEFVSGRFDPSPLEPSQLMVANDPAFGVAVVPDASLSDLTIASQSLVFDRNQGQQYHHEPQPQEMLQESLQQERAQTPPKVLDSKLISIMSK